MSRAGEQIGRRLTEDLGPFYGGHGEEESTQDVREEISCLSKWAKQWYTTLKVHQVNNSNSLCNQLKSGKNITRIS